MLMTTTEKGRLSEYRPRGNFNCHMGIGDKYIRFNMNVNQNFGCGETPPLRYIVERSTRNL